MAEFAPPLQMGIGNDILDIGSRKARRRGADPMMMGTPGQFDVPNVSNVSSYRIVSYRFVSDQIRSYHIIVLKDICSSSSYSIDILYLVIQVQMLSYVMLWYVVVWSFISS
jgi:hypothetical protein